MIRPDKIYVVPNLPEGAKCEDGFVGIAWDNNEGSAEHNEYVSVETLLNWAKDNVCTEVYVQLAKKLSSL